MHARAALGIFEDYEQEIAHRSTYQLLTHEHKIELGPLFLLKNKKIVLNIERYGAQKDFIDFAIHTGETESFKTVEMKHI